MLKRKLSISIYARPTYHTIFTPGTTRALGMVTTAMSNVRRALISTPDYIIRKHPSIMKPALRFPSTSSWATLTLSALLCGISSLAAAEVIGSGNVVSETRTVSGFHGVELQSSGDVAVTQGDTEGLVIEAEDNVLPLLVSTVDANGILHLGVKPRSGSVRFNKPVIYKLAVKTLDIMKIAGSGDIHSPSLSGGHLRIELPGSGNVTVDRLKAETVAAEIEGSGNIRLAGEAHSQKITIGGSGDYRAKDFKTDDTSLQIDGSGNGSVWADGSLKVEINGSGDVGYRGNAKPNQHVNGSGEVHPLDR